MCITVFLTAIVVPGCGRHPPPAATTNLELTEEEGRLPAQLSSRQQQEILAEFRELTRGRTAESRPVPSPVPRWSDMPLAVELASADVEMAVVTFSRPKPDRLEFTLKHIADFSGTLTVQRTDAPPGYLVQASIGWRGERSDVAANLLRALDRRLQELSRRKRFPGEPSHAR